MADGNGETRSGSGGFTRSLDRVRRESGARTEASALRPDGNYYHGKVDRDDTPFSGDEDEGEDLDEDDGVGSSAGGGGGRSTRGGHDLDQVS